MVVLPSRSRIDTLVVLPTRSVIGTPVVRPTRTVVPGAQEATLFSLPARGLRAGCYELRIRYQSPPLNSASGTGTPHPVLKAAYELRIWYYECRRQY
eukprot:1177170-Rhodomonas_salina.1